MKEFETIRVAHRDNEENSYVDTTPKWGMDYVERTLVPPEIRKTLHASMEVDNQALAVLGKEELNNIVQTKLSYALVEQIMPFVKIESMKNMELGNEVYVASIVIEALSELGEDNE